MQLLSQRRQQPAAAAAAAAGSRLATYPSISFSSFQSLCADPFWRSIRPIKPRFTAPHLVLSTLLIVAAMLPLTCTPL